MKYRHFVWFVWGLTFVGCSANEPGTNTTTGTSSSGVGGDGGSGGAVIPLSMLRVEPLDAVRDTAYATGVSVDYKAWGTPAAGGAEIEVPAIFDFSEVAIGSFTGATLDAAGLAAGKGQVTVTYGGQTASTSLEIRVHADVTRDGLDSAVIDQVLAAPEDVTLAPTWTYPEEGTLIPPNLPSLTFRYTPAPGTDTFVAVFEKGSAVLRVATKQPEITLAGSDLAPFVNLLGPGVINEKLYGFSSVAPTNVGLAKRIVRRSELPLNGAMYYWASNGTYAPVQPGEDQSAPRGYFRYDFNQAIVEPEATSFLGFNRAGDRCVGCHAVSLDGEKFATSFETDTHFAVMDVASTENPVTWTSGGPTDGQALGHFNVFSPDGKWLFVTGGSLIRAYDVSKAGTNLVATFPTPVAASHITVSPKSAGTLVYVEDMAGNGGTRVDRGRLVRVDWDAATNSFGTRTVMLEDPTASVYYPSVSPDGVWLLYNRTTNGGSLSNPLAEVWATRMDGSGSPVQLVAANKEPAISNSWPRWAPFLADDGEGHPRYFFTFSSVRGYGSVVGRPQLWMSSFDPAGGADPSTPALWLPIQKSGLNNHAAQWTQLFIAPPK